MTLLFAHENLLYPSDTSFPMPISQPLPEKSRTSIASSRSWSSKLRLPSFLNHSTSASSSPQTTPSDEKPEFRRTSSFFSSTFSFSSRKRSCSSSTSFFDVQIERSPSIYTDDNDDQDHDIFDYPISPMTAPPPPTTIKPLYITKRCECAMPTCRFCNDDNASPSTSSDTSPASNSTQATSTTSQDLGFPFGSPVNEGSFRGRSLGSDAGLSSLPPLTSTSTSTSVSPITPSKGKDSIRRARLQAEEAKQHLSTPVSVHQSNLPIPLSTDLTVSRPSRPRSRTHLENVDYKAAKVERRARSLAKKERIRREGEETERVRGWSRSDGTEEEKRRVSAFRRECEVEMERCKDLTRYRYDVFVDEGERGFLDDGPL